MVYYQRLVFTWIFSGTNCPKDVNVILCLYVPTDNTFRQGRVVVCLNRPCVGTGFCTTELRASTVSMSEYERLVTVLITKLS